MTNDRSRQHSIVLAGGGTAGHVNPLLATADAVEKLDSVARVTVIGTSQGLEAQLVPAAGLELKTIERVPFPRRPNLDAVKFFPRFRKAIAQAGAILDAVDADTVVGFGGYVSTPVYLAAKRRNLRIIAHEGNARPGLANKLAAHFANVVALSFRNTPLQAKKGRTVVTGLPLRAEIGALAVAKTDPAVREANAAKYGFDGTQPILLVTGGSLGAQHINEVISHSAQAILDSGFQVLHLCGKGKADDVRTAVAEVQGNYVVLEYATEMDQIYSFTDLVVTRAGAGMVSEIAALGIPAVFVPLPIGNGEQALNAADLVEVGGAVLIADQDFSAQTVSEQLLPLLNRQKLDQMAQQASSVSRIDAAQALAKLVLDRS